MRAIILTLAWFASMFAVAENAAAQAYPSKPIRMIVGFPPGGGTDVMARIIGQKLTESWGQQVLIENRGGATGTIAADVVAKSAPDGYTLSMGHVSPNAIAQGLFPKLPYDCLKDFAPVVLVSTVPQVLVLHPSIPANNVRELVALLKAKPQGLQYASSGSGSTQHLAAETFKLMTHTEILHVPYKGSGQAVVDLIAGQVSMNFDTMPSVIQHIKAGKLHAIGVTTPKRSIQLPDVPTIAEQGLPGFDISTWYGVFAPAGTPKEIVSKLNLEIARILKMPDVREKLAQVGGEPGGGSVDEFTGYVVSEVAKYSKLVREANITMD